MSSGAILQAREARGRLRNHTSSTRMHPLRPVEVPGPLSRVLPPFPPAPSPSSPRGPHQWKVPVGVFVEEWAEAVVVDAWHTRARPKSATLARRSAVRSTLGDCRWGGDARGGTRGGKMGGVNATWGEKATRWRPFGTSI